MGLIHKRAENLVLLLLSASQVKAARSAISVLVSSLFRPFLGKNVILHFEPYSRQSGTQL
jgi:hypothetical protein